MFYVYMLWTFYARFADPYHGYGTKAEWINNIKKLQRLEEGLQANMRLVPQEQHSKCTKLENAVSWWNTRILILKIHIHPRQIVSSTV